MPCNFFLPKKICTNRQKNNYDVKSASNYRCAKTTKR